MNVIFLGAPGSGKGTQAKKLAEALGLIHISTGDLFRDAIGGQSELGKEIKAYVDAGKLVPDHLVSEVLFKKLRSVAAKAGVLLDGYPRTIEQAKALDGFAARFSLPIDAVLFFEVDPAELVKRLAARRQCPKCKEVYNLEQRAPRVENVCDRCSSALVQRSDDQPDVLRERLSVYSKQTAPLLDYYKNRSGFKIVNAGQNIERVSADVRSSLGLPVLNP